MSELQELFERGRAGDRSALSALIGRFQTPVAGLVAALLRPAGEAAQIEDVCQAVFVKLVLGLGRLKDPEALQPWLFQIARNACRDHLRRRRSWRRWFSPLEDRHANVAPLWPPEVEANGRLLERALARLDPGDRGLLTLTLEQIGGRPRSYVELAAVLGLSVAATRSRLFRTRARLGAALREGVDDVD